MSNPTASHATACATACATAGGTAGGTAPHTPVMVEQVLSALKPRDRGVYVDGTFGDGGHSRAILAAADCTVWAIDRDPSAIAQGEALAGKQRLRLLHGRFSQLKQLLATHGIGEVQGILFDLGASAAQLGEAKRGFSFQLDGKPDMRMDPGEGRTAADFVNKAPGGEIERVLRIYGEERKAKRLARLIVKNRPIVGTHQLAKLIASLTPNRQRIHPATRSFQALRIFINDELGELAKGLEAARQLLAADGTMVVISFHSLEDRIVKQFMKHHALPPPAPSRHLPPRLGVAAVTLRLLHKKPLVADGDEIARNPRSRSAKLRAASKIRYAA